MTVLRFMRSRIVPSRVKDELCSIMGHACILQRKRAEMPLIGLKQSGGTTLGSCFLGVKVCKGLQLSPGRGGKKIARGKRVVGQSGSDRAPPRV